MPAVPRRLAYHRERRLRRREGGNRARQLRMAGRIKQERHPGLRRRQQRRGQPGSSPDFGKRRTEAKLLDVMEQVNRIVGRLGPYGAVVENDLLVGVETVDKGEIDQAAKLGVDDRRHVLWRRALDDFGRQATDLSDSIGEFDSVAAIAIRAGIDRHNPPAVEQGGDRQRAPAEGVADDQCAAWLKRREQMLEQIDFLHSDAETVRQARAVLEKPGERRTAIAAETVRRQPGRDRDALGAVEVDKLRNDRHGAPRKPRRSPRAKRFLALAFGAAIPSNSRMTASSLETRLRHALRGEVLFDAFARGRYATDASIYQIEPVGVVVPRDADDVAAAFAIAREDGVALLPRGGGTSQCGQTVGRALVLDCSKYMNQVLEVDVARRRARVQPGVVMDRLNRQLRNNRLFFPVDVSTGDRATIGGMTANNSCGTRSLRYGNMVHNVRTIDALLPNGTTATFGEVPGNFDNIGASNPGIEQYRDLVRRMRALHNREKDEIDARFPKVQRRVGGYNIDTVSDAGHNMAHLLVGSEGTLAFFNAIEVELQPIPPHRVLGICHFPSFYRAMQAAKPIVALGPAAVELVDRTMIELARDIPLFRATVDRFVKGEPEALLLVEFAGENEADNRHRLKQLVDLMGTLGHLGGVVEIVDDAFQSAVWDVRKQGLNIMMSMKGDGKPVSFVEDCAVPLADLPDYTARLDAVFKKHGTTGTWYAHASVGCLHVRPVLNLKQEIEVKKLRAIAEEAFAMVREYKGSHSGEHGDGLVRSEFHEAMFGPRLVRAFEEVKDAFDPAGLMNPGKIVRSSKMDDRSLFRFKPGYATPAVDTALDWSAWGGFAGAVEMCNNNGACRARDAGVMCPSYRATLDEQHLTRGRANTLRLALSGQLGAGALASAAMRETLELCISCKGCKRECPTGVDMARMKIEFLHQYRKKHPPSLRERLIAYLPRYASYASRVGALLNLYDRVPGLVRLGESLLGFSARRKLPRWHARPYVDEPTPTLTLHNRGGPSAGAVGGRGAEREVVLFADTFNRWFEPENARAALRVLERAGYTVLPASLRDERPLCCGRTFLSVGLVSEAKEEARRTIAALKPFAVRGIPIIGLEPSCLLTLRDEFPVLNPGADAEAVAKAAALFEEFVASEAAAGRFELPLKPLAGKVVLHTHCHQKALNTGAASVAALKLVPGLAVETFDATCCGMAGAFGYEAEHYDLSLKIGELSVLPKMRAVEAEALIVAAGTSCRCQIADGARRNALHPAQVLDRASA
jgi:FAD/FMN-containing dehydrogenase/Fe-S oxidoreductase